jgi:hypothetical protein
VLTFSLAERFSRMVSTNKKPADPKAGGQSPARRTRRRRNLAGRGSCVVDVFHRHGMLFDDAFCCVPIRISGLVLPRERGALFDPDGLSELLRANVLDVVR